jgi:hypothetical protein
MSNITIRNIIIATIITTVTVGLSLFMLYQVSDKGTELSRQIELLGKQQAQVNARNQLKRQAQETEAERALLASYFLARQSDGIDFLNQVEALAPRLGVTLETESLESDPAGKWIAPSFIFSGTKEAVFHFIKVLETLPYVQRITEVSLEARSSNNWEAKVTMKVQVLEYEDQ